MCKLLYLLISQYLTLKYIFKFFKKISMNLEACCFNGLNAFTHGSIDLYLSRVVITMLLACNNSLQILNLLNGLARRLYFWTVHYQFWG
jgi:hypothetical protein